MLVERNGLTIKFISTNPSWWYWRLENKHFYLLFLAFSSHSASSFIREKINYSFYAKQYCFKGLTMSMWRSLIPNNQVVVVLNNNRNSSRTWHSSFSSMCSFILTWVKSSSHLCHKGTKGNRPEVGLFISNTFERTSLLDLLTSPGVFFLRKCSTLKERWKKWKLNLMQIP